MRLREWKRCTDPVAMLQDVSCAIVLPDKELPPGFRSTLLRRLRVFTLTAAKPVLDRVNHPACHTAAEIGWRLAEGTASAEELAASAEMLRAALAEGMDAANHYFEAPLELWVLPRLVNVLSLLFSAPHGAAHDLIVPHSIVRGEPIPLLTPEETRNCCWLLREVFGNRGGVLMSPQWEATWRTDTAVILATQMYESRDFGMMPILGDALQDAGCDNEDILGHCRGAGPHVRGCWVVDLVLGKGLNSPSNRV